MKTIKKYKINRYVTLLLFIISLFWTSCESFVEVDPPNNQIIGQQVFEDAATVDAAFAHIYGQLRDDSFASGNLLGLSYLMGHYSDELTLFDSNLQDVQSFNANSVLPSNSFVKRLWESSYNLIYATNSILEGVENSTSLSQDEINFYLGEAYFLRAYIHFNLVNLYGPIPYIKTTDYRLNSVVQRMEIETVYQNIISDLLIAKNNLDPSDISTLNFRPNYWVSVALLSRVYLYNENWELAINEASDVISNSPYTLNSDVNEVFLKNSAETLWQLDSNTSGNNTNEAGIFIFVSGPPPNSALSNFLINDFGEDDLRFTNWVNPITDGADVWYAPFKYKFNVPTSETAEYSILFRLAELYLIVGEAHIKNGNVTEGIDYLNMIRLRAGLEPVETTDQNQALNAIMQERRIEFFTEQGHRFFDLKRTDRANAILSPVKPNWNATDIRLPIPESELVVNPNLQPQNDGY